MPEVQPILAGVLALAVTVGTGRVAIGVEQEIERFLGLRDERILRQMDH